MTAFFAHKTAVIDKGAIIAEGTKIWHSSHIMSTANIGKDCVIGQNCYVAGKIGHGCKLQNNVNVYLGVTLSNYVFCGPSMTFTNDLNPRAKFPKNGHYITTTVKEGVSFGAGVVVVCGKKIGKWALVGAGSVVTSDLPNYSLAYGSPAKVRGWVCECGSKLPIKFEKVTCGNCGKAYTKKGVTVKRVNDD